MVRFESQAALFTVEIFKLNGIDSAFIENVRDGDMSPLVSTAKVELILNAVYAFSDKVF